MGTTARIRLAENDLLDGRPRDSLDQCRGLLNLRTVDTTRVHKVMGRAYESLGQFDRAAACFAGRPPP